MVAFPCQSGSCRLRRGRAEGAGGAGSRPCPPMPGLAPARLSSGAQIHFPSILEHWDRGFGTLSVEFQAGAADPGGHNIPGAGSGSGRVPAGGPQRCWETQSEHSGGFWLLKSCRQAVFPQILVFHGWSRLLPGLPHYWGAGGASSRRALASCLKGSPKKKNGSNFP